MIIHSCKNAKHFMVYVSQIRKVAFFLVSNDNKCLIVIHFEVWTVGQIRHLKVSIIVTAFLTKCCLNINACVG